MHLEYFLMIIDLLHQVVQQQQQIINLLAYVAAILLALISNTAVYQSTEAIQSSYVPILFQYQLIVNLFRVDTHAFLAVSNFSSPWAQAFFEPHDMSMCTAFTVDATNTTSLVDLFEDLNVVYHNVIQDNIDISPSLLTSFRNLALQNAFVNSSVIQVLAPKFCWFTDYIYI